PGSSAKKKPLTHKPAQTRLRGVTAPLGWKGALTAIIRRKHVAAIALRMQASCPSNKLPERINARQPPPQKTVVTENSVTVPNGLRSTRWRQQVRITTPNAVANTRSQPSAALQA